jgi:regulator of protease activity HflC (stomatin/prohibitin superfamily)
MKFFKKRKSSCSDSEDEKIVRSFLGSKKYEVRQNQVGYLYRNNIFERELKPGYYTIQDWKDRTRLICVPSDTQTIEVTHQETLTKDIIAFRFSYTISYRIVDGQKLLNRFTWENSEYRRNPVNTFIRKVVHVHLRNRIAQINSDQMNEKCEEIARFDSDVLANMCADIGVIIEQVELLNLTFSKRVQALFSQNLEAKIRAQAELENARTVVATARTLKNASELMKGDDNLRFLQMIETITKIADKGKHSFVLGDLLR